MKRAVLVGSLALVVAILRRGCRRRVSSDGAEAGGSGGPDHRRLGVRLVRLVVERLLVVRRLAQSRRRRQHHRAAARRSRRRRLPRRGKQNKGEATQVNSLSSMMDGLRWGMSHAEVTKKFTENGGVIWKDYDEKLAKARVGPEMTAHRERA